MNAFRTMKSTRHVLTIQGLSLILGLSAIGYVLSHPDPITQIAIELVAGVGAPAILAYAGFRVGKSDFESDEQWIVLKWTIAGILVFGAVGLFIILHQTLEGAIPIEPLYIVLTSSSVGALGGIVGGVSSVRSRHALQGIDAHPADSVRAHPNETDTVTGIRMSPDRRLELIELFSNVYCRKIVEYFIDSPTRSASVEELVEFLVHESNGSPEDAVGTAADPYRNIELALDHIHLTRLADAGVVRYDSNSQTVEYVLDAETEDAVREAILPLWTAQTARML